jgi:hypothetical protein
MLHRSITSFALRSAVCGALLGSVATAQLVAPPIVVAVISGFNAGANNGMTALRARLILEFANGAQGAPAIYARALHLSERRRGGELGRVLRSERDPGLGRPQFRRERDPLPPRAPTSRLKDSESLCRCRSTTWCRRAPSARPRSPCPRASRTPTTTFRRVRRSSNRFPSSTSWARSATPTPRRCSAMRPSLTPRSTTTSASTAPWSNSSGISSRPTPIRRRENASTSSRASTR